ncbi:MAG: hypothetical protein NZ455_08360 [Bacteroidia bacterium]|nr:hypothetical protein [Bacteroidia bacterium]MDW8345504.1 hypothetical protein [Bacteroidia bacterium]
MPLGSAKRSAAPSVSAVRSSPTRAQRGTRPKNLSKYHFIIIIFYRLVVGRQKRVIFSVV